MNGTKTYFLYDEATGDPAEEYSASGGIVARDAHAPDGLIGQKRNSQWTFYAYDPQGSVAQRTTSAGSVTSSAVYDAYGAESVSGTAPTDPFGFNAQSGYVFDRENGLYYCEQRYYDPANGRWVTRDPIGAAGGVNLYGYCEGGPVENVDASGLDHIIIRGDDANVPLSGLGFYMDAPVGATKCWLTQPKKQTVVNMLISADDDDDFYFWGHGSGNGSIWINEKEKMTTSDLDWIASQRKIRGKGKLRRANLHACETASTAKGVNAWLKIAVQVDAYCGLTAQGYHINSQQHYKKPLKSDPARQSSGDKKEKKHH